MTQRKPPASKPSNEKTALEAFREHAAILRSQGACRITASFGPDIVFTAEYPEDEEPRTLH